MKYIQECYCCNKSVRSEGNLRDIEAIFITDKEITIYYAMICPACKSRENIDQYKKLR
jgi:hypothetical protein